MRKRVECAQDIEPLTPCRCTQEDARYGPEEPEEGSSYNVCRIEKEDGALPCTGLG